MTGIRRGPASAGNSRGAIVGVGRAAGFTLMEMIVALGLFSVVMATATEIFLMAGRGQRKAFNIEQVQAAARFTLEAITREMRTGSIDYAYYADRGVELGLPEEELALIASDNVRFRIFKSDATTEAFCPDSDSTPCLLVKIGASAPASITPRGVVVENSKFYIAPLFDPYFYDAASSDYLSDQQPRVTIMLYLKTAGGRVSEQAALSLQTTAVSRVYRR